MRMKWKRRAAGAALACSIPLLVAPRDAGAVTKTWVVNSGSWSGTFNWSPAGAPADFDNVSMFGANSMSKTVTYDINDGFLHVYGTIGIQSAGQGQWELRQPGTSLEAASMSIAGTPVVNGRARHVLTSGGTAFVGSTFLADNGLISVGAGSAYHVNNLTQDDPQNVNGGQIIIDPAAAAFTVAGTYDFRAGSVSGPLRIESTGGLSVGAATFGGAVDNFGSLAISTNTNFTAGLTNRAPFTILGPRVITAERWDQRGGAITQFGETRGGFYTVQGGATWTLMGGIHQGTQIAVGNSAGDGTYVMPGGSINMNGLPTARIIVGNNNTGSFLQSGGDVRVPFLYVGGSGTLGSGRGLYRLDAGSLLCTGQMWVGTENAAGGTYVQTGGRAEVQRLIVNDLSTSSGSIQISGGSLLIHNTSTNNGSWTQTGGEARVEEFLDGAGSLSVTGTGSLTVSRLRQRAAFIGENGRLINNDTVGANFNQLNRVNSLAFEEAPGGAIRGRWDLDNTLLAIDYTGTSPMPDVKRYLASGYAGGSWNGTGLGSSMAAAFGLGLGYAEASDVIGPGGGIFNSETVDGTTVLVRYTIYGDANLDEAVNLQDFNRLAANFGGSNKIWSQGDFNYDGVVNLLDFNRLAGNFGMTFGPTLTPDDWAALAAAVPEPSLPLLSLGLAASAAASRRARRRCM